jgi:hypothetical protein
MSAKISGQVWDFDLPTNEQLVLLAMTDHADHIGENMYPSVGLIAWKTGYSERQVQRLIKSLVAKGILEAQEVRTGKTTIYKTNFANAPVKTPYRQNVTPDTAMSPPPRHSYVTPTPDIAMSPEPSLEPSVNQKTITPPSGDVPSADAEQPSNGHEPTPKKERPPCKWEPLHDALLEAFGLEKDQMTPKADKIYWTVAHELYVVNMTPDQIPDFHTFMANKAKANDWSDWTVSAMAKYAPDFLRDGSKKSVPEFTTGMRLING